MADLGFRYDWLTGEGLQGPELAATYAALEVRVGSATITRVWDHHDRALRDCIHVPLYPLAESLASNWWFITGESRIPTPAERHEYRQRHSLVHGGDGFLFPDLIVVPDGERLQMQWFRAPADQISPLEFLDEGREFTSTQAFRDECATLIESVLQRLHGFGIKDTYLQREWNAIRGADAEEMEYCKTAAGLGWDPYDLDDARREAMGRLGDLGGLRREAVAALVSDPPGSVNEACAAITRALEAARTGGAAFSGLDSLRREVEAGPASEDDATPWSAGRGLARRVRQSLDSGGAPLRTTEEFARALGHSPEALNPAATTDFGAGSLIDGVVANDSDGRAAFAFRPAGEESRRFHLCRALAEALTAPATDAVLTGAPTHRQQRGWAFAAEFLVPEPALRDRVHRPFLHEDDLSDIGAEFGVSPFVIGHQVENHRIAEVVRLGGVRRSLA